MFEKPESPHRQVLPLAALTVGLGSSPGGFGCGDESEPQGPAQTLARPELETVPVPLDEDNPAMGSVDLHYLRYPAADPSRRIGTLLVHFGGPGTSAVSILPQWVPRVLGRRPEIVRRFDIVGLDERGVGRSPRLDCASRSYAYPGPDQGRDAVAAAQEFAEDCGRESEQLDEFGTSRLIRDLDRLREHLGEPQLHILGYSYGSFLAFGYASAFPERAGRIVADAVLDPTAPLEEWYLETARGFDDLLTNFLRECASEPDCAFGGNDPEQAFRDLLAELPEAPTSQFSQDDFLGVITIFLTDQDVRPFLEAYLVEAEGGNFQPFIETFFLNAADAPAAFDATMCMDLPRPTLSQHAQLAPLLAAEAPLYGGLLGSLFLPCVFWPVEPEPFNPELEAIPSILLINSFDDARTPHLWTDRTEARIPGRGLVEVEGFQHGSSLRGNECVDDIVTRYLIEGELPEDTRCRS